MNGTEQILDSLSLDDDHIATKKLSLSQGHFSPHRIHLNKNLFSTDENRIPLDSNAKSLVSNLMETAYKDLDTIKQTFTKVEYSKDQIQSFVTLVRDKLDVKHDTFDVMKKNILTRIDELLAIKKEKEVFEKQIIELKSQNDQLMKDIQRIGTQTQFSSEELTKLLKNNDFIFRGASLASILKAVDVKPEERANVDKIHIDYQAKKVLVEYLFDGSEPIQSRKFKDFPEYKGDPRKLIKSLSRITKRFLKLNIFVLQNVSEFSRFMKERAPKTSYLNSTFKGMDMKQQLYKSLMIGQEDSDKSMCEDNSQEEFAERLNSYVVDLLTWWDQRFRHTKEIYQQLSKDTMEMIDDLQVKLLKTLEKE